MRRVTLMIIPDDVNATRQLHIPKILFKLGALSLMCASVLAGYFVLDYLQLRQFRQSFHALSNENEGLKGEARILMHNLEDVKRSLRQVQDYTSKLSELTTAKVQKFRKKTGIGPLSKEEFRKASEPSTSSYMPSGINLDNLVFRPVFSGLTSINDSALSHAYELQQLLSTLSQQKSLLSSIPSLRPVNGWITSGYGHRISPFTGNRTMHRGIDVASPVGTPIYAPADGVVVFSGAKAGFGNFIMIAHGYGIVTRYGHNHQNMVHPGQKIRRGEQIATVGQSGRTTGPHLHYEIWVDGRSQNPRKFVLDPNEFNLY